MARRKSSSFMAVPRVSSSGHCNRSLPARQEAAFVMKRSEKVVDRRPGDGYGWAGESPCPALNSRQVPDSHHAEPDRKRVGPPPTGVSRWSPRRCFAILAPEKDDRMNASTSWRLLCAASVSLVLCLSGASTADDKGLKEPGKGKDDRNVIVIQLDLSKAPADLIKHLMQLSGRSDKEGAKKKAPNNDDDARKKGNNDRKPNIVQVDLNQLPPDLAKRLIAELARSKGKDDGKKAGKKEDNDNNGKKKGARKDDDDDDDKKKAGKKDDDDDDKKKKKGARKDDDDDDDDKKKGRKKDDDDDDDKKKAGKKEDRKKGAKKDDDDDDDDKKKGGKKKDD